jgi:hypothetical protein
MEDFSKEGFVVEDSLSIRRVKPDSVFIEGRIRCQAGLYIDVEKRLTVRQIRRRTQVRTARYSYHAGIEGSTNRSIFRYDNAHAFTREGHPDAHHIHHFDPQSWRERKPPEWIGEADWPHLSDVIEELRQWWETTGRYLDLERSDEEPRRPGMG